MNTHKKILALCGGVGGVKLAYGLTQILVYGKLFNKIRPTKGNQSTNESSY